MTWRIWLQAESSRQSVRASKQPRLPLVDPVCEPGNERITYGQYQGYTGESKADKDQGQQGQLQPENHSEDRLCEIIFFCFALISPLISYISH